MQPSFKRLLLKYFNLGFVTFAEVNDSEESSKKPSHPERGLFQVPPHTPITFSEAGGRALFR